MAFQETELHKLHLRLQALEGNKEIPAHLKPAQEIHQHSTVKFPTILPDESIDETKVVSDGKSRKSKGDK